MRTMSKLPTASRRFLPSRTNRVALLLPLLAASLLLACGGDDDDAAPSECLTLPANCEPSLPTDYDSIYKSILNQRCGSVGTSTSCHTRNAVKGGLSLADPQTAYDALLGGSGNVRVKPGDAACSPLMQRLESKDPEFRMPYQEPPLNEGLRCAIQTWIEDGAQR